MRYVLYLSKIQYHLISFHWLDNDQNVLLLLMRAGAAGEPKEGWSAPKHPGSDLVSDKTPADDVTSQTTTDCENFTLAIKQLGFWALQLSFCFWVFFKICFNLKRGFRHFSSSPVLIVLSASKTPLTLSLFQEWLDTRNLRVVHVLEYVYSPLQFEKLIFAL